MCFLLVIVVLAMTEMSVAAVSFRNVIAKLYLHCFINTSHLSAGYPAQIKYDPENPEETDGKYGY